MELGAGRKDRALPWPEFLPFLGIQMRDKWGQLSYIQGDDETEYFLHLLTETCLYFPEPVPLGPLLKAPEK